MAEHRLWIPPEERPKPHAVDGRLHRTLNAAQLSVKLREVVDEAMTWKGDVRSNSAALRKLRRILEEYPDALRRSHITYNLSKRRMDWLESMGLR